jgi:hypothetical protein
MEENRKTRDQGLHRAPTSKRSDPPHHGVIGWLEVSHIFLRSLRTSDAVALSLRRVEPHLRSGKLATSSLVCEGFPGALQLLVGLRRQRAFRGRGQRLLQLLDAGDTHECR